MWRVSDRMISGSHVSISQINSYIFDFYISGCADNNKRTRSTRCTCEEDDQVVGSAAHSEFNAVRNQVELFLSSWIDKLLSTADGVTDLYIHIKVPTLCGIFL